MNIAVIRDRAYISVQNRIREASAAMELLTNEGTALGWTERRLLDQFRLMAWLSDLRDEEREVLAS